jgi:hypothetical protein
LPNLSTAPPEIGARPVPARRYWTFVLDPQRRNPL